MPRRNRPSQRRRQPLPAQLPTDTRPATPERMARQLVATGRRSKLILDNTPASDRDDREPGP